MFWRGWGDPQLATPLPAPVRDLVQQLLGSRPTPPPVELDQVSLPASVLPAAARAALATAVGSDHVRADAETRIQHTRGKSTADLLRIRAGDGSDAPDAVVLPGSHDEVGRVLAVCAEHRIAAVPFGGGTSVVGGLQPRREPYQGVLALDLRRLDRVVAVDAESRLATLEAGLRAPRAEELLRQRGFTLGHYPQSYEWATIGGFAATRSSGQASAGYGRFDELVVQIRMATPAGTLVLGLAPRSAAGPDLRQLVLGSEGAFGVVTSVTVQIRPVPETTAYEGWRFATFTEGLTAVRRLAQDGPLPTVVRLSDETETAIGLAQPTRLTEPGGTLGGGSGCLLVLGFEGFASEVAARRSGVADVLTATGAEPLGSEPGKRWAAGRFAAPYLRDALLDAGVLAETLETATFWTGLPRLYDAVRGALTTALTGSGGQPVVMCHLSHVYPAGGSLYFTVVCAQEPDAVRQWTRAKTAASEAIIASGGTISHHHGIGTDHREWLTAEIGSVGLDVLRAVKTTLDPTGVMNPGVLIP